ncbi:acylneuraminate cytidylyltransferase family protein [Candidatus Uhrbacteria bacterium]|nr:acylneuraminate cytidylyltransferase family protein [Candidatus Uhrbacteria bacterium]
MTIAIIPARGGSKRLPKKNARSFAGRPLIAWTIAHAQESGVCDRVVVTTDDADIAAIAAATGGEVIHRPPELATDTAKVADAVVHTLDACSETGSAPETLILLQPTSPLRTSRDIVDAVAMHQRHNAAVVSVMPVSNRALAWSLVERDGMVEPVLGWGVLGMRSQDLPSLFIPNGALYVVRVDQFRMHRSFYIPPLFPYVMPVERSMDIDTVEDFTAAERAFRSIGMPVV